MFNYQHLITALILQEVNVEPDMPNILLLPLQTTAYSFCSILTRERGAKGEPDLPIKLQVLEFSGLLTLLAINDAFLLLLLIEEHQKSVGEQVLYCVRLTLIEFLHSQLIEARVLQAYESANTRLQAGGYFVVSCPLINTLKSINTINWSLDSSAHSVK